MEGVHDMKAVKFSRYDTVDYLQTEEEIAAYLDAAVEDGDPALIAAALGDIARAKYQPTRARHRHESRRHLSGPVG